ncbi:MGMT family protein [Halobacillus locisalis]|uniref:MGMT family protein n=1 Tax=Halobacillus locisalis TaxID=220753 RepID=A0A838CSH7_9BACI|nr:MGMT family protein [Halobacillus locisalis]MBA2175082.1 MGMT family protein [Halobacillus locisalis]
MQPFTKSVIEIIQDIPEGKVMTYGQVARVAGNPRAARQVARLLHTMSEKHSLPWHRVVNAKGNIVIKDEAGSDIQRMALESEGIPVINGKIDLSGYQVEQ